MRTFGIIIIWACITAIKDTTVLGYVIDPYDKHWKDSRSLYSNSGLQIKEMDGLDKPVVVLVARDRNANRDTTNEVDSKSITHPGHKTKRCKSLTPLQEVRLSALLKEVNNDESELQSSNFMTENEVAIPSSKLTNIPPVNDENNILMDNPPIPRFKKHINENEKEIFHQNPLPNEDDAIDALGDKNPFAQLRKKQYLCYCIDEECINDPMKPVYPRNKNRLGPKLLQNTDLYSQLNALAATNSQETLGRENQEARPLIATRKQGRKRPSNKRPTDKKCTPIIVPCATVSTDNPTKITLPLALQSNPSIQSPAPANPYHTPHNNYPLYQTASAIPNAYYGFPYGVYPLQTLPVGNQRNLLDQPRLGSAHEVIHDNSYISPRPEPHSSFLEDCIRLYGREFCPSSLASLPQHRFQNNYYQHQHGLEDTSKQNFLWNSRLHAPAESFPGASANRDFYNNGFSSVNYQDNNLGQQYPYATSTGTEISHFYQQHNTYPQFPVVGSKYAGYDDPGYINSLEDPVKTGVVSDVDYDAASTGVLNESAIKPTNIPRPDLPALDQKHDVIVQPGFSYHEGGVARPGDTDDNIVGKLGDKPPSSNVNYSVNFAQKNPVDNENVSVSYDEHVQDSSMVPVSPAPGVVYEPTVNSAGVAVSEANFYKDIDKFRGDGGKHDSRYPDDVTEGRKEMTTMPSESQEPDEILGTPGSSDYSTRRGEDYMQYEDSSGQPVPSTDEFSSESPMIGKSYEPSTSSVRSTNAQEARQPVDSTITMEEVLNQEGQRPVVAPKGGNPMITRLGVPQPIIEPKLDATKPLAYVPVTEHYIKNGEWYEAPATIIYKSEFPELMGTSHTSENVGASNDYANILDNSPIKYHSPEDIILNYIKNHPKDEANVGAGNPENFVTPLSEHSTENPSTMNHLGVYDEFSEEPIMGEYLGKDFGADENSIRMPVLGQSQAVAIGKKEETNSPSSRIWNPIYFGKIIAAGTNSASIDNIDDLESTDLFYIGEGVKLPLTIKKINDGSLALMISSKSCNNFVKENCPCCVPRLGHVIQNEKNEQVRIEKKENSRWISSTTITDDNEITEKPMSGENSQGVTVMPVDKFAKKYNLTLNLKDAKMITSLTR